MQNSPAPKTELQGYNQSMILYIVRPDLGDVKRRIPEQAGVKGLHKQSHLDAADF